MKCEINANDRREIARLVYDAKNRHTKVVCNTQLSESSLRITAMKEAAEQAGATEIQKEITKLRTTLDSLKDKLHKKGFTYDYNGNWVFSEAVGPELKIRALKTVNQKLQDQYKAEFQKFDGAVAKIWTAETREELKAILDSIV